MPGVAKPGKAWQGFPTTAGQILCCHNRMTCQPWQDGLPTLAILYVRCSKVWRSKQTWHKLCCRVWNGAGPAVKLSLSIITGEGTWLAIKQVTWLAIKQVNEVYYIYVKYVLMPPHLCLEKQVSHFQAWSCEISLRSMQSSSSSKVECSEISWREIRPW